MKKLFFCFLSLLFLQQVAQGQCTASFTYTAFDDSLVFANTSVLGNARFYWSFGDGDGSNEANPQHIFPDDGFYTIALYAQDTVSTCVDVFEVAIQVTKPDTFLCIMESQVLVTIPLPNVTYLTTVNNTTGCPQFSNFDCDAGPSMDGAWSIIIDDSTGEGLWLSRIQAIDTTGGGYAILEEFYHTAPVNFSSLENYESCSANFEVVIEYQMGNAVVHLKAMDRFAFSYEWTLSGFGPPLTFTGKDLNHSYPYINHERAYPWVVSLKTANQSASCFDTVSQNILIRTPNYVPSVGINQASEIPFSFSVYPNPAMHETWLESIVHSLEPVQVRVFDMMGNIMEKRTLNAGREQLNLSDWATGFYFVEAINGNKRIVRKLLIVR